MVEKEFFYSIGAFNEIYQNGCEDVDFCLKSVQAGRVNVCANRSEVLHHVSASRGRAEKDEPNFSKLWKLWGGQLKRQGHVDPLVHWWRMASWGERVKQWKRSLHALTADPTYFEEQ